MLKRNFIPDIVTDQTSAHDPLNGYLPVGLYFRSKREILRNNNPEDYVKKSKASMAQHVQAMLDMQEKGAITLITEIIFVK